VIAEFQPVAEKRAVELWTVGNPGLDYQKSPDTGKKIQGYLDGVITSNGDIQAVVEMKCRDADWFTFENLWSNKVMVRRNKLDNGKRGSRLFGVPFVLMYYLAQDDVLMEMAVTDSAGNVIQPVKLERTQTMATIKGGEAFEMNAFIDMTGAVLYKGKFGGA
tara:strand:- start:6485 stop:6970 length:486 start_codon:yes stop_codon:yes gene_type:complete